MKRLLYFASDFRIGLSALLSDQLISIAKSGVEIYAVAGENEQEAGLSELLCLNNINITRIPGLDAHHDINSLIADIYQIVTANDIDIIHVQNNWQLAIAGAVKLKLLFQKKVLIAYTIHGFRHNNPFKSRIAQILIGGALFVLADHVICMTNYLRAKFKLLSYKIDIIPLGVKNDFFTDKFIAPPIDYMRMIFPAQFRNGKNQDLIIRAFAKYISSSGDTTSTLTLPGAGELEGKLKSLAQELGIIRQVIFPGLLSKNEIKQLYLDSNIAIVASNSETFGQSIVEPFVIGRCVISTPVGIAPEIIENDINGFIFNTEDDLCNILTQISQKKSILKEIGMTNYTKRDQFSWSHITSLYTEKLNLL